MNTGFPEPDAAADFALHVGVSYSLCSPRDWDWDGTTVRRCSALIK
jgi:hypothetical protein